MWRCSTSKVDNGILDSISDAASSATDALEVVVTNIGSFGRGVLDSSHEAKDATIETLIFGTVAVIETGILIYDVGGYAISGDPDALDAVGYQGATMKKIAVFKEGVGDYGKNVLAEYESCGEGTTGALLASSKVACDIMSSLPVAGNFSRAMEYTEKNGLTDGRAAYLFGNAAYETGQLLVAYEYAKRARPKPKKPDIDVDDRVDVATDAPRSAAGQTTNRAMTGDQRALKELVDEATLGGRKPLSVDDADTILDWAREYNYPGVRASPGDVGVPSNWTANPQPHIHIPGAGRGGHVPVQPGVQPR